MARLLLCDDDKEMGGLICTFLEGYGHDVQYVTDSAEVHSELRQSSFDLMICSTIIPSEGGYALAKALRRSKTEAVKDVRILLTGPEEPKVEEYQVMRKFRIQYMMKYHSPEDWLAKIQTILRRV